MILNSEILNKDHLKIIVTDSGLGGLSVQALLDKELRKRKIKPNVDLIFYNSLASHDYGYNSMPEKKEKIRVFDSALNGMLQFQPDLILIACNTLSVLYPETNFSKNYDNPVFGIIDSGVELIIYSINKNADNTILLFGTETTISSNAHHKKLIANGIKEKNIFVQSCKYLESEIQINPLSKKVESLLIKYITEISKKITDYTNSYAVLCCTHYGYSEKLFQKNLNEILNTDVITLNPNNYMVKKIASEFTNNEKSEAKIDNMIYSKVDISKNEINILSRLLDADSQSTAQALRNYKYLPTLFGY